MAVDPSDSETIYAGSFDRLLRSGNGGQDWTLIRDASDRRDYLLSLVVDPAHPSTLYLGTGVGVFKSTDRGDTWISAMQGLPSNVAAFKPLAFDGAGAMYVGTLSEGMFKSTNGGGTWTAVGAGLPFRGPNYNSVRFFKADPYDGSLFTSLGSDGLFKSTNGGIRWDFLGLSGQTVNDLIIDPASSSIYAATNGGVFRSINGGLDWASMNDGLTNLAVTSLTLDTNGRALHAGTYGGGVFDYDFSTLSAVSIVQLPDDRERLPNLLAEMAAERSTRIAVGQRKSFLIAAAANTVGANGTFFRSDVTLINRTDHEQQVVVAWLSAGEESIITPTFKITLPPRGSKNGWIGSPPATINDFVRELGLSGLGSLLFIAVDLDGKLARGDASIDGFSRIWSPATHGGSVSQSFSVLDPLELDLQPHGMAVGFRHDENFRTNLGIVNLDTKPRRFDVRIVGEFATTELTVNVPGLSLKQIALPTRNYGTLAIEIWAEHSEDGVGAFHFPWAAYGSSVDNVTGDGWTSQVTAAQ
jgi:hypothetical protein